MKPRHSWQIRYRTGGAPSPKLCRTLRLEPLESRLLLDGEGFQAGTDVHLSLSFAADGTEIAGQANALTSTFDSIAPTADWQEAILRAFQTWAVETNADVGVRSDNGDPFGSPGPHQQDDRFGDIRIGAIAMSPEVGAVSVPVDSLVSGTWFADVVFNTAFDYQTLDDIYAVALHEAGNVFGLEDNSDVNSPLFTGADPTGLPPTAADLADLQELHGTRLPDVHEMSGGNSNNDSFANATRIKLLDSGASNEGAIPSFVYGDITNLADRDYYEIHIPGDYSGNVTLQLRSSGISLLSPSLSLFDDSEQLITQELSTSREGDFLTLSIVGVSPDDKYYVEVDGASADLFGIGGYSLVTIFDGINQVDQATINSLAGGQYRFLNQEDFEEFFDADEDDLLGDDLHTDDTRANATELESKAGFVDGVRYEFVGSIADSTDIDFYRVNSPRAATPSLDVMTVLVRSLDARGLAPRVSVLDGDGLAVPHEILANGGGDYILQATGIVPDNEYFIKIEAQDATGYFNTGNYDLAVLFGSDATQLTPMSAGTVGAGTTYNIHKLYVGQPQLFHFALAVDPAVVASPTAVVVTIKDALGETVYQIAARPGETRSREAVLLAPGEYTVEVVPYSLAGGAIPALSYSLLGTSLSDLFVGDPNDPNAHPFACTEPGLEGFFCYPGDFISPDPFLWDTFIESLTTAPEVPDLPALISLVLGDWWSWVWEQSGVNGPPLAVSDTTQVQSSTAGVAALFIGPTGSVLENDIDPENDSIVAILQSPPAHGSLELAPDGTFNYVPEPGFQGRDSFTYVAFDFSQQSAETTVSIIVGESSDFDADGDSDGTDFLIWQRNLGTTEGAVLVDGDSNFDGAVNAQDLSFWENSFSALAATVETDFDADGDTDGTDFLLWQRGFGKTSIATVSDGDTNADGDVDHVDLTNWELDFGAESAVAAAATEPLAVSALLSIASFQAGSDAVSVSETREETPVTDFAIQQLSESQNDLPSAVLSKSNRHTREAIHDRIFSEREDSFRGAFQSARFNDFASFRSDLSRK